MIVSTTKSRSPRTIFHSPSHVEPYVFFPFLSNKACLHPAAPPEVCKIGLSAVAPLLSASTSTLSPIFLSVLVSLTPSDRKAMLGETIATLFCSYFEQKSDFQTLTGANLTRTPFSSSLERPPYAVPTRTSWRPFSSILLRECLATAVLPH